MFYLASAVAIRLCLPDVCAGERAPAGLGAGLRTTWKLLSRRGPRRLLWAQGLPVAFVASAGGLVVAYSGRNHFGAETYALLMACLPILPRGGYCGRAREK
ncbi:hypothetical protein [Streptomyces sp. NEAU-H3]|uniref:hypothetical protein n=1 Tax=Streptomyces sp. NEAU-H3 TaxID=2720636 RepID=UPI00143982BC|nr:hypothetical protein [Streptomyces sp. NEAU-H3]NJA58042.1 hypothetical protein [Streptomyces sp. NEAU-H3]